MAKTSESSPNFPFRKIYKNRAEVIITVIITSTRTSSKGKWRKREREAERKSWMLRMESAMEVGSVVVVVVVSEELLAGVDENNDVERVDDDGIAGGSFSKSARPK